MQTRARQLRHEMTPAEAKLWECLRNHQLDGYKFRRQHPIGRFIVDFYCPEQKRVVAIDGPVHHEQTDRDEERTQVLQASGYRVYHWTNEQVEQNLANEPQPVSNVTSVESMTRPVLGSTESESRRRADLAIRLLDEWMADESGYDEETWPELKAALDVKSCRTWNDPLEDAVMTNKAARLI